MVKFLRRAARKIDRLVGVGIHQTYLYRTVRPQHWSASAPGNTSLQLSMLTVGQIDSLLAIGPFDVSEGQQRFDRGDCCYTVRFDDSLMHYSWVQRSGSHPISEAGIAAPVENGEFWIYNCRTSDRARGQGLYPATLRQIVNDHFSAGYGTAWIYTSRDNLSSQKGILKAGFHLVTTLSSLRVGSHHFGLVSWSKARNIR